MALMYDKKIDSLITYRIDEANNHFNIAYNEQYNNLTNNYNVLFNALNSANKDLNIQKNKLKEVTDKLGYSKMFFINEIKFVNNETPSKLIIFKDIGVYNLISTPTIFIAQKNDFDFKIREITNKSVNVEISNAKVDTIKLSLLVFLK